MPNDLQINPAFLAELAKTNNEVLNNYPLQEKPYDFDFVCDGYKYHFAYDGSKWTWDYKAL